MDFDKTEPEIFSVQHGKSFTLGQTLAPEFQCTDATSQIDTCVADITKLDTSSVGAKSYHVTGFDKAGNTRTISASYEIHYKFVGISPPSLDSKVKQGSTVPLKFKLLDNGNKPISTASARLYIDGSAGECSGNSGNVFKYDSREQQYSCGMLTKGLTIGTHAIEIRLDDGTVHKYRIRLTR